MISELRNRHGEKLDFRFHESSDPIRQNHVVVIGHGVTANLDRPWAEALANGLAGVGIDALRISFSGNGESEGDFRDSCITREVEDLGSVLDALQSAGATTSYAGHSMGGAVGFVRTPDDPRIEHFISLAGMVETARFAEEEFGMETPDEGVMWEEDDLPLSSTFMNDLRTINSLVENPSRIHVPILFVHGADDDLVPPSEAEAAFANANEPKEIAILEGVNHVFGGTEEKMVGVVVGWMRNQLAA